jgi:hypothetical protein
VTGGTVTFCEACGDIINPRADDVVRLVEWADMGATFEDSERWVPGFAQYFHRAHAPELSMKWREPPPD